MPQSQKALSQADIEHRLKSLPGWNIENGELVRRLEFPRYLDGLDFVNRLGRAADKMDHHPSIALDYKKVTVRYSTHSPGGITDLDFQAAELANKL